MYRNLFHCLKFLRIKIVRNFDARHEGGMKEAEAGVSLNWILIWSTSKFKGSQSYKVRYCPLKKMLLHLKLCVHMCRYICGNTHVEARGSLAEISSLLLPHELRELNWGPQA